MDDANLLHCNVCTATFQQAWRAKYSTGDSPDAFQVMVEAARPGQEWFSPACHHEWTRRCRPDHWYSRVVTRYESHVEQL